MTNNNDLGRMTGGPGSVGPSGNMMNSQRYLTGDKLPTDSGPDKPDSIGDGIGVSGGIVSPDAMIFQGAATPPERPSAGQATATPTSQDIDRTMLSGLDDGQ